MTQTAGREPVTPDEVQARVEAWGPGDGHLLVLGAPGTGKSTAVRRLALRRARELADRGGPRSVADGGVLVLVPQRRRADRLQLDLDRETAGSGAHVDVRTASSLAVALLAQFLGTRGEPVPTLLTGADVDAVLGELLEGHRQGDVEGPAWPRTVREETLALPAFRHELRDLLTRAAEEGLGSADLAELGRAHSRPEWVAAAAVMREYEDVLTLGESTGRGRRYDHARVLAAAARALEAWAAGPHARSRPRFSLVVVDDHQDSTAAVTRLVRQLAADGAQVVLTGNPDVAVQQFRGGRAHLVGEATEPLDAVHPTGFGARVLRLPTVHRGDAQLARVVRDLSGHVRPTTTGGAHRRAVPAVPRPDAEGEHPVGGVPLRPTPALRVGRSGVEPAVLPSVAAEGTYLARRLREEHLLAGVPWQDMAVLVRSSADVTRVRAALRAAEVPTDSDTPAAQALRSHAAVRPLLDAVTLAADAARGVPLPGGAVRDLAQSVVGGLTSVQLRLLLRALRARAEEGEDLDTVLVEAMWRSAAPGHGPEFGGVLGSAEAGLARVGRAVAAGRDALTTADGSPAVGVPASRVLWEVWNRTGLARLWQAEALAGGAGSERAHEDLDAVLALFAAAERYDERTPGGGIRGFLGVVRRQDLPQDTLGRRGSRSASVQVLTAATAAGSEYEVVAVAGVQEDSWPNLRIRDTLLGTGDLVDLLSARESRGLRDAREKRREVLDDELRLFVAALSRASRLAIVTAVASGDQRPSMFVEALAGDVPVEDLRVAVPDPLSLRGLVGTLRREAEAAVGCEDGDGGDDAAGQDGPGEDAVRLLAHLAAHGVPWADPRTWQGASAPTSDAPLTPAEERVRVSPSGVEKVRSCALNWLLTTHGGEAGRGRAAREGTVVHAVAEAFPHGTRGEMQDALTHLLPELGYDTTRWLDRTRVARLREMVDRLAGYVVDHDRRDPDEAHVRVETALADAHVGERAIVAGRIDRLERVEDTLDGERVEGWRVVDFKTGTKAVSANEARVHPQLAAYQVGLEAAGLGRSLGARLVYLGNGRKVTKAERNRLDDDLSRPTERSQDPLAPLALVDPAADEARVTGAPWREENTSSRMTREDAVAMIDDAAQVMGGATFVPTPGELCRVCPVAGVCPLVGFQEETLG